MNKFFLILFIPVILLSQIRWPGSGYTDSYTKLETRNLIRDSLATIASGGIPDSLDAAFGSDRVPVNIKDINANVNGDITQAGIDSVGIYEHLSSMKRYNVLDYGFDNTGTTDNSEKFFTLVNTTLSDSSIVYFPTGTYLISTGDTIEQSIVISGAGMGQTIIDCATGDNIFVIGNDLIVQDITFKDAVDLFQIRYKAWRKANLEYFGVRHCRFVDIVHPIETSNLYNADSTLKSVNISNNIVDSCDTGFQISTKFQTCVVANNQFTNMFSTLNYISYCMYIGAPLANISEGTAVINNNTIDSMYVATGDLEHNGLVVYAHKATIVGNTFARFGIGTATQRGIGGMYLAGANILCVGNSFYNVSKTNVALRSQDVWTKGAIDAYPIVPSHSHVIANNMFYTDRDSAGYCIYTQSPAHIIGNEFRSMGDGELVEYCCRLGVAPQYYDYDKRKISFYGNKIYSNRDFASIVGNNMIYTFSNNQGYLSNASQFVTNVASVDVNIGNLTMRNNEILNGIFLVSPERIIDIELSNNLAKSNGIIIDLNEPVNMNVSDNTFILDTSATITQHAINITPTDTIGVINWTNNTHIVRNTLGTTQAFIWTGGGSSGGGYWFSNNNKFIMDSVASVAAYARAYTFSGQMENITIENDKFITLGTKAWTYALYNTANTISNIKMTGCFFDDYVTNGFRNSATVGRLEITNNNWNGVTTFYQESGTCAIKSIRQNLGVGIYHLSTYVDADSLYEVIYDFDNTVQDTIGILRGN